MHYMLLIYTDESGREGMSENEKRRVFAEYGAYTETVVKSGHYRAGDALQPTATATTVRVRDGKTLTTDGPFAETREQLGGYYLVDAPDLDAAIALAARIPGARTGSIEIRPVLDTKSLPE